MKQLLMACLVLVCSVSMAQKKSGSGKWIQLFNGKDLSNWDIKITGHPLNENYGNTFRVKDGNLQVGYEGYAKFDEQFGHIFYKQKFSAYLLVMEYRFIGEQVNEGPGWAIRNSGAMVHSQSAATMGLKQDFPISIEVQLLGGNGKDDRPTANLCTPGTNVVIDDQLYTDHCLVSHSKTYHGEQWVKVEVLVLGDSLIRHIVEGETALEYQKPQIGGGSVGNYDPAVKKDGQLLKEGYIALQSESHPVEFRKVALFDLGKYWQNPKKLEAILAKIRD
jgi:Domain of Unknown Function (DUF1080)